MKGFPARTVFITQCLRMLLSFLTAFSKNTHETDCKGWQLCRALARVLACFSNNISSPIVFHFKLGLIAWVGSSWFGGCETSVGETSFVFSSMGRVSFLHESPSSLSPFSLWPELFPVCLIVPS